MSDYKTIISREFGTVVADIKKLANKKRESWYQSKQKLEESFIEILKNQNYEYLEIHDNKTLVKNLRKQIERLNNYKFQSDNEWNNFYKQIIGDNKGIEDKTEIIQRIRIFNVQLDNGTTKNIKVIEADKIHDNHLQVINQYEANNGNQKNRYDVTILVNGLPLVHIELKRRGIPIKEAFNQIKRYQKDSFWSDDGLFEFVQIFVISNGTETKYYSNTTRKAALSKKNTSNRQNARYIRKNIQSFEFTSYWSDEKNNKILDLMDFARTFFVKKTILNILTKYCVFDTNKMLIVMRPYQITATEKILSKIAISKYEKTEGTNKSGGYIWHTTGSGKTLTSFKTAELAQKIKEVEKVIFVVDRRDLDYQTINEYKRFASEFAAGVKNTKELALLLDSNTFESKANKVYVVTIQKLSNFIKDFKKHSIYNKKVVFIFDECHRSQFGQMHKIITKAFRKYYLFGFTGTPIFESNSNYKNGAYFLTTETLFGEKLHTYTIVDAIDDGNVLPFRIDYIDTVKAKSEINDKQVNNINTDEVLIHPKRIENIVSYILEHYDQKTKTKESYHFNKLLNTDEIVKNKQVKEIKKFTELRGFNSIFAVANIDFARAYYNELRKQNFEKAKNLKISTIFTYSLNKEQIDEFGELDDEDFENIQKIEGNDRDFLQAVMNDYNNMFNTTFNLKDSESFQNFYKDVSLRMKNREIDILIVVNMFLTGFDSTTLNTLWLDKPLRQHGLVQAFSRTNRILNSIKTFGNIVTFRDIANETDQAIALFGNKDAKNIVLLKSYNEYINGYKDNKNKVKGYKELTSELKTNFPIEKIEVDKLLITNEKKKEFITLFGKILRLKNILTSFDNFENDSDNFLDKRAIQDYESIYLNLEEKNRQNKDEKESIIEDVVFEIELVRQDEINVDYILKLISKGIIEKKTTIDIKNSLRSGIDSSPSLRNKKDLIFKFIDRINTQQSEIKNKEAFEDKVNKEWEKHALKEYEKETNKAIKELDLNKEETFDYMRNSFENGEMQFEGRQLGKTIREKYLSIDKNNSKKITRRAKRIKVFEVLKKIFDKFLGLIKPR
ncbi:type I restriction endonuclease subunit R [Mycoplasmopsis meleagridis]|uniref:type I restriction endonuclease subunit R n=1 Tax=Mycoplasmopsis meleagridis TaxID=29561 RepID=UPI003A8938EE